jgi:hypothetical protein
MEGGKSSTRPLYIWKEPYLQYRRLGGSQDRSGRCGKSLLKRGGFEPATARFIASIILMSPVKFLMRFERDFLVTDAVLGDIRWRWDAVQ